MNAVVIRLSSLGDVILAGSITKTLQSVVFITRNRYKDIAKKLIGVSTVITPTDPLPQQAPMIIDLQGNWRAHQIATQIKGPRYTIAKPRWKHWQKIIWKRNIALSTIPERYARTASCSIANKPWISIETKGTGLVLCPGSKHLTKCWPLEYFVDIANRWPHDVFLLGSIAERDLLSTIAELSTGKPRIICEDGFEQTLQALALSCVAVGNDSGLMHLAAATGLPVLMLFGPTTAHDGFWCHEGFALELPLFCRPCSRFGGSLCPIGDHACLRDLQPDIVWATLKGFLP